MRSSRRELLGAIFKTSTVLGGLVLGSSSTRAAAALGRASGPRSRVMIVNDLSGNVDGLFAAVHAKFSPSIDIRGIVGTGTVLPGETAARSAGLATELLNLLGSADKVPVFEGAPRKLSVGGPAIKSAGTQAIIDEAMRSDSTLPLYLAVGGGLTEVASALMIEPRIADRFTLIWIGGGAYPSGGFEFNVFIDPVAAMFVFNESRVPIWQVPSDVYGTCLVTAAEVKERVEPCGAVGAWLASKTREYAKKLSAIGINSGEVSVLGDSPLVLLTALTDGFPDAFQPPFRYRRTGSSRFDEIPTPKLTAQGVYESQPAGRPLRLYRSVDTRMMFGDLFAKLRMSGLNNS